MQKHICNKCGKKMNAFDLISGFTIDQRMSYGSSHDLEYVSIRLCCECSDKLIDECTVSPLSENVETSENVIEPMMNLEIN